MIFKTLVRALAAAAIGLATMTSAQADTLILKDGTVLEGTIDEETPEFVRITVQVTKSIRDLKTIQRADIKEVIKLTPAEIAYSKLREETKIGDLADVAVYDSILNTKVKPFLEQFPDSPNKEDAMKMLAALEEERKKVAEGYVQLGGEWLTPEQIAADPFNHAANVLFAGMEKKMAAKDFTGVLSDFEKLGTQFDESKAYARSIPVVKQALDNVDAQLAQMKVESEFKIAKRKTDLAAMPASARVNTENAFQRQMEIYQKNRESAEEAGQVWLPISIWDPVSIEDAMKVAETKRDEISALDPAVEMKRAALVAQVIGAVKDQNWGVAAAQAGLAKEAGAESSKLEELVKAIETGEAQAASVAKEKAAQEEKERLEKVRMEREKEIAEREEAEAKAAEEAKKAPKTKNAPKTTPPSPDENTGADDKSDKNEVEDGEDKDEKKEGGGIPLPFIIAIIGIMAAVTVFMIKNRKAADDEDLDSLAGDDDSGVS